MNPKEIPENLDLAQNLLGQWLRYRQFYYKGVSKDPITPQEEAEFLEISSSIAQNTRKLVQRLDEKQFPFRSQDISTLLRTAISIAHFRNLPVADQKVFYKDWHVSSIYLSRTVGAMKFLTEGYRPKIDMKAPAGTKGGMKGGMQAAPSAGAFGMKGGGSPKAAKKGSGGTMKTVGIIVAVLVLAVGGWFLYHMFAG